jgi:MOSC domain-containing protein YiiM
MGSGLVLEVTCGRIPCRTFQEHLGEKGWVRRFTHRGAPGAYLRVIEPGEIRSGDPVEIVHRPGHDVTVAVQFRAATTDRKLLPRLLAAGEALHPESLAAAREYVAKYGG